MFLPILFKNKNYFYNIYRVPKFNKHILDLILKTDISKSSTISKF